MDRLAGSARPRIPSQEPRMAAQEGIDLLFRRHYAALLRVAVVMLGSRDGAEDAVQDAFVSLFRHWARLRDPAAAESYLRSAVLNRCRSGIRDRIRNRALADLHVVPLPVGGSDTAVTVHQDNLKLAQALRQLPQRQREVVACRYLFELSVAETAETLGISGGAVKRHTHRGLRSLHNSLEVTL
jgi:RNA polymerase sigma-70 factor (sigma-E family)